MLSAYQYERLPVIDTRTNKTFGTTRNISLNDRILLDGQSWLLIEQKYSKTRFVLTCI